MIWPLEMPFSWSQRWALLAKLTVLVHQSRHEVMPPVDHGCPLFFMDQFKSCFVIGNTFLWCKNVTSSTGGSNWPPLVQKRDVNDRGIQPTSYSTKTWCHWQGDPIDLLCCKNVTSLRGGNNRPPLVQKRDVTNRGIQLTSFGAKTWHYWQGDPTDLLWCKNVTSLTGGSCPFRCLDKEYKSSY